MLRGPEPGTEETALAGGGESDGRGCVRGVGVSRAWVCHGTRRASGRTQACVTNGKNVFVWDVGHDSPAGTFKCQSPVYLLFSVFVKTIGRNTHRRWHRGHSGHYHSGRAPCISGLATLTWAQVNSQRDVCISGDHGGRPPWSCAPGRVPFARPFPRD